MSLTDKTALTDKELVRWRELQQALQRTRRRYYLHVSEPIVSASDAERERLIMELGGDLLGEGINDPEWVRREFGRRFGSGDPGPSSAQDVDTSQAADGVVRVTFTLTSVHDWDRLRRAGFLKTAGLLPDDIGGIRGVFRDHAAKREHGRRPETIVRAVAVHYLSRKGGGSRTAEDAARRYADANQYADALPSSSGSEWDAGKHGQIIAELAREYGPLP